MKLTLLSLLILAGLMASGFAAKPYTNATVIGIARVNGAIGPPANAVCCIEYTFETAAQKVVAVRFWYYKAPKESLKVGDHVKVRRKRSANNNFQVSDADGQTQMMYLVRTGDKQQSTNPSGK